MLPQLRDSSFLNDTSATAAEFLVPLPQASPGDPNADPPVPPTLSLVDGDQGVALLVWSAVSGTPYTPLHTDWNVLLPPTVANKICFALLAKRYASGDPVAFPVTLEASRYLLAAATWWSGVARVDALGPVGINSSAVSDLARAPSLTASGVSDELVLSAFASASTQSPISMVLTDTDPDAAELLQWQGTPGTVTAAFASAAGPGLGPTGDVLAHFNLGSQSRAGVQLGLLATGAQVGGVPAFAPSLSLGVQTLPTLTGDPAFTPEVGLLVVDALPGSRASFSPTLTLAVAARSLNRATFNVSVQLAATGRRVSRPAFAVHVKLAATGYKKASGQASFGARLTLAATGRKGLFGNPQFDLGLQLATSGGMHQHGKAIFASSVQLAASGRPSARGSARFTATVRLSTSHSLVRASGTSSKTLTLTLRAHAVALAASGQASFAVQVSLAVEGIPDFTPVGLARFAPALVLAADGYTLPAEPIGITIKPIALQADPDWHGPRAEYEWSVE